MARRKTRGSKQLMRIGAYTYLCTGSLINNTAEDKKPYILTSQHCLYSQVGKEATEEEMKQWIFYFNYEHIRCGDERIAPYHTITGCKLLASSSLRGGSDGMLLMLNRDIPENLDIYFNGWDRRDIPAVSGVCIHHPNGDVKKYPHLFIRQNITVGKAMPERPLRTDTGTFHSPLRSTASELLNKAHPEPPFLIRTNES